MMSIERAVALAIFLVAPAACRRSSSSATESVEKDLQPSKSVSKAKSSSSASASSSIPSAAPIDPDVRKLAAKEIAHGIFWKLPRGVATDKGEPALVITSACDWSRVVGETITPLGSLRATVGSCPEDPFGRIGGTIWGVVDGPAGTELQVEIFRSGISDVLDGAQVALSWSDGRVFVGRVGGGGTFDGDTNGPMLDLDGLSCPEGTDARAKPTSSKVDGAFVLASLREVPKCDGALTGWWLWTPKHDGRPAALPENIRSWPQNGFAGGPDGAVWLALDVGADATTETLAFYRIDGDAPAPQSTPPDAGTVRALARGAAGTTWAIVAKILPRDAAGIQHVLPSRLWVFGDRWRRVVIDGGPAEEFTDVRVIGRDVFVVVDGRLFHAVE